jgi:hypothetical protein
MPSLSQIYLTASTSICSLRQALGPVLDASSNGDYVSPAKIGKSYQSSRSVSVPLTFWQALMMNRLMAEEQKCITNSRSPPEASARQSRTLLAYRISTPGNQFFTRPGPHRRTIPSVFLPHWFEKGLCLFHMTIDPRTQPIVISRARSPEMNCARNTSPPLLLN